MKKLLSVVSILLLSSVIVISCTSAGAVEPRERKPAAESTAVLSELNLSSSVNYGNSVKEMYLEKYGLKFHYVHEIQNFTNENDLMIAESQYFIGNIPDDALNDLQSRWNIIKNSDIFTEEKWIYGNKEYSKEWMEKEGPKYVISSRIRSDGEHIGGIYVVGPSKEFDQKAILEDKIGHDPIILYRIPNGYIELAQW